MFVILTPTFKNDARLYHTLRIVELMTTPCSGPSSYGVSQPYTLIHQGKGEGWRECTARTVSHFEGLLHGYCAMRREERGRARRV